MKLDFDTKTGRLQIPFRPTTARQTQATRFSTLNIIVVEIV
jgi:hypothetical protein